MCYITLIIKNSLCTFELLLTKTFAIMKQFKTVTFDFVDDHIIILKEAMEITTEETNKKNTSINFIRNGFEITEEIDERFFFSFARNYGNLLKS